MDPVPRQVCQKAQQSRSKSQQRGAGAALVGTVSAEEKSGLSPTSYESLGDEKEVQRCWIA
ncbi:MAG: hypothetical protein EP343_00515 [Deltaproteobacteria bacterium]|nr:MAG: hypothetical protein EP343_00515 [Deltaproteobacteria bacterium]